MDAAPSQMPAAFRLERHHLLWAGLALLVCIGTVDWWWTRRQERRFDAVIVQVARQTSIDPALVKAVVWRESRFNPKARGRVGELGLMQIRPAAAQEWAQAQGKGRVFEGNLFEPVTNLQVGSWYLAKLLKRYARTDNPAAYALADYNAGRSNVLRWNKGAATTNSTRFVEQITFPGTQEYVRAILQRSVRYQDLRTRKSS
jgi:soluble lytic murein transglycosylase